MTQSRIASLRVVVSFSLVLCAPLGGCGSSADELGSVKVGAYTFDVSVEGDAPAAGVSTRFVMKSTAGGNPTSITGWVGGASGEGSSKVLAEYDSADGDYDDNVTCPSPMPAGAKFYFDVDTNGKKDTGSIAF